MGGAAVIANDLLHWLWPLGRRAWCVSDCLVDHCWRGWVVVLWHRRGLTYVVSTDLRRAFWVDWSRGHLFRDAPPWWRA